RECINETPGGNEDNQTKIVAEMPPNNTTITTCLANTAEKEDSKGNNMSDGMEDYLLTLIQSNRNLLKATPYYPLTVSLFTLLSLNFFFFFLMTMENEKPRQVMNKACGNGMQQDCSQSTQPASSNGKNSIALQTSTKQLESLLPSTRPLFRPTALDSRQMFASAVPTNAFPNPLQLYVPSSSTSATKQTSAPTVTSTPVTTATLPTLQPCVLQPTAITTPSSYLTPSVNYYVPQVAVPNTNNEHQPISAANLLVPRKNYDTIPSTNPITSTLQQFQLNLFQQSMPQSQLPSLTHKNSSTSLPVLGQTSTTTGMF
ncbi:cell wall protein, partial [Reticulomyxa filosa]